jgi:CBS domain-containing protein
MTTAVRVVQPEDTVATVIAQMQQDGLRSLVVDRTSPQDAYGILTERDIVYKVVALGLDPAEVQVRSIMRHPCIFLEPHLTLREAALTMSESGIQRAPVLAKGELIGIVSITDLVMKGMVVTPV